LKDRYISPLSERYASAKMQYIFSQDKKFKTWRKLWIALAETEKELGLNITDEQIEELKKFQDDINFDVAKEREKEVRHDVMSHVYAYGVQCPKAKGIIHLGATSCYVGDNTDIIIMKEALELVKEKLVNVINELSKFAREYKDLPTLAFTHFQPAQPTTVGKRATLWINELLLDYEDVNYTLENLKLLGCKGTTGTQASFVELFDGDDENQLLKIAACLEEHYPHSIANAVVKEAKERKIRHKEMHSEVQYIVAHGIASKIEGDKVVIGSYHFVIEDEKNKKENLQLLSEILKLIGFKKVSFLTAHEHDEIIAFTSQLTHAIAVSLVNSDSEKYDTNRFIGDSYRDLTRIAKINEDLWAELFMGNKKNLLKMIQQFERELDIIKDALNNNDLGTLKEKFIISTKRREKID